MLLISVLIVVHPLWQYISVEIFVPSQSLMLSFLHTSMGTISPFLGGSFAMRSNHLYPMTFALSGTESPAGLRDVIFWDLFCWLSWQVSFYFLEYSTLNTVTLRYVREKRPFKGKQMIVLSEMRARKKKGKKNERFCLEKLSFEDKSAKEGHYRKAHFSTLFGKKARFHKM